MGCENLNFSSSFYLGFKPQFVSVLPYLQKLVGLSCLILFKEGLTLEKKAD